MPRLTSDQATEVLHRIGATSTADFFSLDDEQKDTLKLSADEHGYRDPRHPSGRSRLYCWFLHVQRSAKRNGNKAMIAKAWKGRVVIEREVTNQATGKVWSIRVVRTDQFAFVTQVGPVAFGTWREAPVFSTAAEAEAHGLAVMKSNP